MTPTSVHLLKLAHEVVAEVRFRDWAFHAGDVLGIVFVNADYRRTNFFGNEEHYSTELAFLGERATRIDILRALAGLVRSSVATDAMESFTFHKVGVFARGGA